MTTHLLHSLVAFTIFVISVLSTSRAQLFEGEECNLASGVVGRCKKSQDCPDVKQLISSGRNPIICSFNQTNSVVCCADNATMASTLPNRGGGTSSMLSLSIGDSCTLTSGSPGECKSLQDCPAANTISSGIPPKLCYFQQSTPIVCCPSSEEPTSANPPRKQRPSPRPQSKVEMATSSSTTPRPAGRTSVEMCSHYAQFVFELVPSASLFIDPTWHNESQCKVQVRKNSAPGTVVAEGVYNEFPHITSLGYGSENNILWKCAGSLISENFILTASLCINSPGSGPVRWARIGDVNPTVDSPDTRGIQKVVEWLTPVGSRPSIALLRLEKYVTLKGDTRPACLHTKQGTPPGYRFATTIGWGMESWDDPVTTQNMRKQDLSFSSSQLCNETRRRQRRRRQNEPRNRTAEVEVICVTSPSRVASSCVGGLGSPLHVVLETPYCAQSILGVNTSGSRGCAKSSRPSVFTRVSDFIPWIESHVWA